MDAGQRPRSRTHIRNPPTTFKTHSNICTYAVSAVAATAVIVRVLYGNLRRDKEAVVRVSIENLMAQLVSMHEMIMGLGLYVISQSNTRAARLLF